MTASTDAAAPRNSAWDRFVFTVRFISPPSGEVQIIPGAARVGRASTLGSKRPAPDHERRDNHDDGTDGAKRHRRNGFKHVLDRTHVDAQNVRAEEDNQAAFAMMETFKSESDALNNELKFSAVMLVYDGWVMRMRFNRRFLYDPTRHACSHKTCQYDRLSANVWEAAQSMAFTTRAGVDVPGTHVCCFDHASGITYCDAPGERAAHVKKRWSNEHLYVCRTTGALHMCGAHCNARVDTISDDGVHTCPITGMADEHDRETQGEKVTTDQSSGSRHQQAMAAAVANANRRDRVRMSASVEAMVEPSEFQNRHNVGADLLHDFFDRLHEQRTVRAICEVIHDACERFGSNFRELYQVIAFGCARMLVSDDRRARDADLRKQAVEAANRATETAFHTNVECLKRIRHGKSTHKRAIRTIVANRGSVLPLTYVDLCTVWWQRYVRMVPPHPVPSDVSRLFFQQLAVDIVKLWYLVKRNLYRDESFPFVDFVFAGMEILAKGVSIRIDTAHIPDVVVFKPRAGLDLLLPKSPRDWETFRFCTSASARHAAKISFGMANYLKGTRDPSAFDFTKLNITSLDVATFESIGGARNRFRWQSMHQSRRT